MKILVRGTNWIGDAVMTIPAMRKLRSLFPEAEITLQTSASAIGIFRDAALFDDVGPTTSHVNQLTTVRKKRFDLAVVLPNSFGSALDARLAGAKRRFGYASDSRRFLLTDALPIPEWKDSRHEVYYYLNVIDAIEKEYFGAASEWPEVEPRLTLTEEDRRLTIESLRNSGVDRAKRLIVLAPGSTNSRAKRWLPENFAVLSDLLTAELGADVILLGSKDDREVTSRVSELCKERPPLDLAGRTEVEDAAGILGVADLLISNDMGLAHVAPAVGTRTIVIFGPTNPVTTRPLSQLATVISANVECAPCMLRECPIDHRCMTRITAEAVFERAKELLAK